jgi:hypothetical protein
LLSRPRFKMGITSCGKTIPPFPALDNTVSCRCIHRSDSVRSLAVYRFLPLTAWGARPPSFVGVRSKLTWPNQPPRFLVYPSPVDAVGKSPRLGV